MDSWSFLENSYFWPKSPRQKEGVAENSQTIGFEVYILAWIDFSRQKT